MFAFFQCALLVKILDDVACIQMGLCLPWQPAVVKLLLLCIQCYVFVRQNNFSSSLLHVVIRSLSLCHHCTYTSTTSRTLLNFKVIGHGYTGFWVFFCVHDAETTRRQYLALSKAR